VFKGAFDEYDWLRPYERGLSHITAEENRKMHAHNRPLSARHRVDLENCEQWAVTSG